MTEYTVSAYAAASPEMSETEFSALLNSIEELGQLLPIFVHGTEIIDGRKRYRAAEYSRSSRRS